MDFGIHSVTEVVADGKLNMFGSGYSHLNAFMRRFGSMVSTPGSSGVKGKSAGFRRVQSRIAVYWSPSTANAASGLSSRNSLT